MIKCTGTRERVFTRQRFTPNYVVFETPLFKRLDYRRVGLLYIPKDVLREYTTTFSGFTGSQDIPSRSPSEPWWVRMEKLERALAGLGVTVD